MREVIEWFDINKVKIPNNAFVLVSDGSKCHLNTCVFDDKDTPEKWIKYWAYLPTAAIREVKRSDLEYCPNYLDDRFDTSQEREI